MSYRASNTLHPSRPVAIVARGDRLERRPPAGCVDRLVADARCVECGSVLLAARVVCGLVVVARVAGAVAVLFVVVVLVVVVVALVVGRLGGLVVARVVGRLALVIASSLC